MREPDFKGPFGRAWTLAHTSDVPDHTACLGSWLVNVPGAHPWWSHWLVSVIHLRDIPGVKPAFKKYPDAGFEFAIYSINPDKCPQPDPDDIANGFPLLTPVDVQEQFHGVSDRDAWRIAQSGIEAMVHGRISPDQDFRPMWNRLIVGTVSHFRQGKHAEH